MPGRALLLSFRLEGKNVPLLSVYAPADRAERRDFYKQLLENLQQVDFDVDAVIFGGDFNNHLRVSFSKIFSQIDRKMNEWRS